MPPSLDSHGPFALHYFTMSSCLSALRYGMTVRIRKPTSAFLPKLRPGQPSVVTIRSCEAEAGNLGLVECYVMNRKEPSDGMEGANPWVFWQGKIEAQQTRSKVAAWGSKVAAWGSKVRIKSCFSPQVMLIG